MASSTPLVSCMVFPFPSPTAERFSRAAMMPSGDITRYRTIRPMHGLYNRQAGRISTRGGPLLISD